MRSIFGARRMILLVGLLAAGAGAYYVFGGGPDVPVYESVRVERGDVRHEVNVTGRVEPTARVTLSFTQGGTLASVLVREGGRVARGEPVARLTTDVLAAERAEAQAAINTARAELDEIQAGTRQEDVAVTEATLSQREVELARSRDDLAGVIERSYQLADNAVRTNVDELFGSPQSDPDFGIVIAAGGRSYTIKGDRDETLAINGARDELNDRLTAWGLLARATSSDGIRERANTSEQHLLFIQTLLQRISNVLNDNQPDETTLQSLLQGYKNDVSSARSSISSLLSELRSAREAYDTKVAAVGVAERELSLKGATPRDEAIAIQEARIEAAIAARDRIDARIAEATLTAPITGVVVDVANEAGEAVTVGAPIVEIISEGPLEISANIPEADIARVSVGDPADVRLDAYERTDIFRAHVTSIAPAERVIEGVATYETTLAFADPDDPRIRPGMTADVDILTAEQHDVLFVPQRTVVQSGDRQYVRVVSHTADGVRFIERDVDVGLRGSTGTVEIVTGLIEGEEVVLFIDDE